MKQDWRNCNGACRLCVSPCCPFRKEPMLGSNEESKKDIEVDSLGNPICPHQTHPHYAIIARGASVAQKVKIAPTVIK